MIHIYIYDSHVYIYICIYLFTYIYICLCVFGKLWETLIVAAQHSRFSRKYEYPRLRIAPF